MVLSKIHCNYINYHAIIRRLENCLIATMFVCLAAPVAKADWYYYLDGGVYKCPDGYPGLITIDGQYWCTSSEEGSTNGGVHFNSDEEFACSQVGQDWLAGVNHFDVWTGNAQRKVNDLPAAGKGRVKLGWARNHNTLDLGSSSFGNAGSWRHSWQFNLVEVPVVGSKRPDLYLTFPSGGTRTFAPTTDHTWIDKLDASLAASADSSVVKFQSSDGLTLTFAKLTSVSGITHYRFKGITTNAGENVKLDYDADGSLVAVIDAGGRKLQVKWRSISLTRGVGKDAQLTTEKVIAEVKDWAGRSVSYGYQVFSEPATGIADIGLVSAVYSDGTTAHYTYSRLNAQGRLLLTSVDDPRYNGVARRLSYTYQKPGPGIGYGMIHQELNPNTGKPYVTLDVVPGDVSRRTVQYSDLRASEYKKTASASGSSFEHVDSLGRVKRTDFDLGGRVKAKTEHNGIRSEFVRDAVGRVKTVTRKGKTEYDVSLDQNGRVVSATSRYKISTNATRDDAGRIRRKTRPDGRTLEYTYDRDGRIASRKFEDGRVETITRDKLGREVAITDGLGATTHLDYDALDRVVYETDAAGRRTHYTYNELGKVTETILPDGRVRRYRYDSYARKISETDEQGRTSQFAYDELSRVIRETDFSGRVTTFGYAEFPQGCGSCTLSQRPTKSVGPDGVISTMLYDSEGQLLSRTTAQDTPAQATTLYAYDGDGNLTVVTDPLGRVTRYTYDDEHHRLTQTDPLGRVTKWSYDDDDNVVKVTAPDGGETKYVYDALKRLVATTDAAGNTTRTTYDKFGRVSAVTNAAREVTRFTYDAAGRKTATIYADGKQATTAYDAAGRPVKTTSPDGLVTTTTYDAGDRPLTVTRTAPGKSAETSTFTYDALGHRLTATDPLGRKTARTYDAHGNVLTVTRPDGIVGTRNTYDAQENLLTTTDAAGATTTYAYDAARNQTSLNDARGSRYTFTYDALHRKTSMTYPDGSVEKWAYDLAGNQVGFTNRAGQTKATVYTAANQPLTETWSAAPSPLAPALTPALPTATAYSYDADGRLKKVDNGTAKLTYTYDDLGRLASETSDLSALVPGLSSHTVGYRYDALGRRSDLVYPDKTKVSYDYDARSRLTTIDPQGGGRTPLATYTYDAQGRIVKLTRDNGVASAYSYDMAGQLTDITHANGGVVLARSAYTLDVLGRRTAQTREDGITETYGYDTNSQLTSADYGAGSPLAKAASPVSRESFAYDALGNRTSASVVGGVPSPRVSTYTANALNQYTQVAGVAFTYDANGNLTSDGKQTYRYDAQNRLLVVEPVAPAAGAVRAEFAYDARNRAVARTYCTLGKAGAWVLNPDDSRALTYDSAWNLLAERTRNGAQVGEYIHGQQTDEVLRAELKPYNLPLTACYPLQDGLVSVVALANDSGKVTERFRYSTYGQPASLSATFQAGASSVSGYRLLFTGREWLGAVGLNEHRNRYYSPSVGKWLSTDPIRFSGGLNLYGYVSNLPVASTDAFGLIGNRCCTSQYSAYSSASAALIAAQNAASGDALAISSAQSSLNGATLAFQAALAGSALSNVLAIVSCLSVVPTAGANLGPCLALLGSAIIADIGVEANAQSLQGAQGALLGAQMTAAGHNGDIADAITNKSIALANISTCEIDNVGAGLGSCWTCR